MALTQIPYSDAAHILPNEKRHLICMQSFVGMFEYLMICRSWLAQNPLEGAQMQVNAAVIELSRTDLRRWYYVGKLTPAQIQERYLHEHGVYAHHNALLHWLRVPAH